MENRNLHAVHDHDLIIIRCCTENYNLSRSSSGEEMNMDQRLRRLGFTDV